MKFNLYKVISKGIFILLLVGASFSSAYTTHIVGGDLTYKCVGNERYEITLTVRRDCEFGADDAPFDDPAAVGFFFSDGTPAWDIGISAQVLMPFMADDTLNYQISSDCGFIGSQVCVHQSVYRKIVRLPSVPGGYTMAYQRCCRNESLNNIVNPLETGSTYFLEITEAALNVCNSGPVFNEWPALYICANEVLNFSHSATDSDGDLLVYSLCAPSHGASFDQPKPQPPLGPPYDDVVFSSPYDLSNLLGGDPLTINSSTGDFYAIPNLVGQFLVGVCVEEYRNGILLSKTKRDFEYNVRVCGEGISADFNVDPVICGTTEVEFENTSQFADSYTWYFDHPNTDPGFISTDENPTFDYTQNGTFTVVLEAVRAQDGCTSTHTQEIQITDSGIDANFEFNSFGCLNDNVVLELNDITAIMMGTSNIDSWDWVIEQGADTYNESGRNVNLLLPSSDDVAVELVVTLTNGCKATFEQSISLSDAPLDLNFDASLTSCDEDIHLLVLNDLTSIGLMSGSITSWNWSITQGMDTYQAAGQNASIDLPNGSAATVTLLVELSNGCSLSSTKIVQAESFELDSNISILFNDCSASTAGYTLTASNLSGVDLSDIEWSVLIDGIQQSFSGNPIMITAEQDMISGTLSILTSSTCKRSKDFQFDLSNMFPVVDIEVVGIDCDNSSGLLDIDLMAQTSAVLGFDVASYSWTITNNGQSNASGNPITVSLDPTIDGNIDLEVLFTNGCTISSSISLEEMNPFDIDIPTELNLCKGDSINLSIPMSPGVTILWDDNNLLGNPLNDFEQIIKIPVDAIAGTSTINFVLTDVNGCIMPYAITVNTLEHPILMSAYTVIDCETMEACFENVSDVITTVVWEFSDDFGNILGTSTDQSPCFTFPGLGVYHATMSGVGEFCAGIPFINCITFSDPTVEINNYESELEVCADSSLELTANTSISNDSIIWCDITNGGEVELGEGPVLTLIPYDGQMIVAKVSEVQGCAEYSQTTTINLNDIDFGLFPNVPVCRGDEIDLSLFATSTFDFSWQSNSIITGGNSTSTPTITIPLTAVFGTYELDFTVTNGACSEDFTLNIEVLNDPQLDFTYMITDCSTYTVCFDLVTPSLFDLSWEFGDPNSTNDSSSDTSPCYSYSTMGNYNVTVSIDEEICSNFPTTKVVSITDPVVSILDLDGQGNLYYCSNEEITLSASSSSAGMFTWFNESGAQIGVGPTINVTPSPNAMFSVVLTDGSGCTSEAALVTLLNGAFNLGTFNDVTVCKGDQIVLDHFSITSYDFEWDSNPFITAGNDSSTPTITIDPSTPAGSYDLDFSASNGICTQNYQLSLVVIEDPVLSFSYEITDCSNFTVCFENTSSSTLPIEWDFGDLTTTTDVSTNDTPCYSYGEMGAFEVTLSVIGNVCSNADLIETISIDLPELDIVDVDVSGNIYYCVEEDLTLTASSMSTGTITWYDANGMEIGQGTTITVTPSSDAMFTAQIVNDAGCASAEASVTLVDAMLDLGAIQNLVICKGDEIVIDQFASSNYDFVWDNHPLIIAGQNTSTPTISIDPNFPSAIYTLTFTVTFEGCSESYDLRIEVVDDPVLSFTYEITDCTNFTVCFENTSSSSLPVEWDFGDLTTTTDVALGNSPCYTYGVEGTYTVLLSVDGEVCSNAEVSQMISVNNSSIEILNVDAQGNLYFCDNEDITITANASSAGNITWFADNNQIGTGTSVVVTPSVGLEIKAVLAGVNGCGSAEATAILQDGQLELDIFQPLMICRGDNINLVVLTSQTVEYVWTPNVLLTDGLDTSSPTVTIPANYPLGTVFLEFEATNQFGCSDIFTYELEIIDNGSLSFTYEVTDCENFTVCFTNTSPMNGILIWNFGDPTTTNDISPDDNPCYTYPGAGTYEVTLSTVTGICGGTPDTMEIILNDIPSIEIIDLMDTIMICDTLPISVSAITDLNNATIEWCDSNGVVLGTGSPFQITPTDGLVLTAKAVDQNNCSFATEPIVFEVDFLDLDYDSPLDICRGDTVTLMVNPQMGITFDWEMSPYILSGNDTGNPTVYVDTSETVTNIILNFSASNEEGCSNDFMYELNVIDNPIMSFDYELTDCDSFTVCFTNTSNVSTGLNWDFGDLTTLTDVSMDENPCYTYPSAGSYEVSLSSDDIMGACSGIAYLHEITLYDTLTVDLAGNIEDQIVCQGDTITLSANTNSSSPITWCLLDSTILGTGFSIDIVVDSMMSIVAKATDPNGCPLVSDTVNYSIYEFDLTLGSTPVVCNGQSVITSIMNNDPDADLSYSWGPEDCIVSGGDTNQPEVIGFADKDLEVTVTHNELGCSVTLQVPLIVNSLNISVTDDASIILGESVDIEVFGTAATDSILWSNGITTISQTVTPTETTTYVVTVIDEDGCSATAEVTIEVIIPRCDDEAVFVPSAFSPNGDGTNDVLYVRSLFVKSVEFTIYNRWGEEIFKSTDILSGWDGTYKGAALSPDSYAFCVKAVCINDEENIRTGNVSLLR